MNHTSQNHLLDAMLELLCQSQDLENDKATVNAALLEEISGLALGEDVEVWVDWYLSSDQSADDKEVIRVAFEMYKTRVKLSKLIAARD